MRCRYCDSELPTGALFCGECGRAVSAAPPPSAPAMHPIVGRPLTAAAPPPEPGMSVATGSIENPLHACEQCGTALAPTDIFCGECGYVVPAVAQSHVADSSAGAQSGESGESSDGTEKDDDKSMHPGERFVLQFSTGESVTVSGSGLIGRNPRPEPGEFFDALVTVSDPSRSVSKTHLEFGQEGGEFWIRDRYSGNGTTLRAPEAPIVHVVADRRYRVPRGARVDIGEQFFVVS